MLDILIGSLMVALALVVVFWVLIFGRPLVRETKNSKGAVETPPIAANDPEVVKTFVVNGDFELWLAVRSVPKIVRRPHVNEHRIAAMVEERHVYSDGLDITLDYDTGGPMNKIKAITGTPSQVRMFITKMWKEGTQKIVFKEWGL